MGEKGEEEDLLVDLDHLGIDKDRFGRAPPLISSKRAHVKILLLLLHILILVLEEEEEDVEEEEEEEDLYVSFTCAPGQMQGQLMLKEDGRRCSFSSSSSLG